MAKLAMGASENKENLPNSCAVTNAKGIPTINSTVPANNPTGINQFFGLVKIPVVTIAQPIIATQ